MTRAEKLKQDMLGLEFTDEFYDATIEFAKKAFLAGSKGITNPDWMKEDWFEEWLREDN